MTTTDEQRRAILLRTDDDVAVAAAPIARGTIVSPNGRAITARDPIALGHKMAVRDLKPGDPVRKYGQVIGFASEPIAEGSWVHVHNLRADLFERDYAFATEHPPVSPMGEPRIFKGFLRPDGRVGTRNYVA